MTTPDTGSRSKTPRGGNVRAARAYVAAGGSGPPVNDDDGSNKGIRRRIFIVVLIAVVLASAAAGVLLYQRQHSARVMEKGEVVEKDQISVFYPDDQGKLVKKTVDVQRQLSDKARAEALLRELKETRCVADRLRIYELALGKDGVLYLDLSGEFIDRNTPEREIAMTFGLVNSFIESFRGAKSVQILVEGQPVYTRSGVLYILEPLNFNRELLEE